jgi:hypothetical protein
MADDQELTDLFKSLMQKQLEPAADMMMEQYD